MWYVLRILTSSSPKCNHRTNVHSCVAQRNRKQRLQIALAELGCRADPSRPQRNEVGKPGGHLDRRNRPRVCNRVQRLLVVDVVAYVEEIPEGEVGAGLDGVFHGGGGGGGGGSTVINGQGLGDDGGGGGGLRAAAGTGKNATRTRTRTRGRGGVKN